MRTGPHQWRGQTQRPRVRACWTSAVTEPKSVDHLDQPRCSFRRRSKAAAPTSRTRWHFCCGRSNGRDLAAYPAVEAAGADRCSVVLHHAAACFCWVHNNTTTAHAAARTTQNTHASTMETPKGSCILMCLTFKGTVDQALCVVSVQMQTCGVRGVYTDCCRV